MERGITPPLNIHPNGLLGFFDIKNGGRYPHALGDVLQPSIDLLRWYVAANSIEVGTTPGPAFQLLASQATTTHQITATAPFNLSDGTLVMVPQTEFWYVDRWSVNWTINSSATPQSIRVVPVTTPAGGAPSIRVPCTFGGYQQGVSAAGIHMAGHASMIDPIILRPGTILALLNEGAIADANGINVNTQLRIARFRA